MRTHADFLVGISFRLATRDRVKLLRLALSLTEPGTSEYARVLFELMPFLGSDDRRRYGNEALRRAAPSLSDLVEMLISFDYLPREDTTKKIKSCIETIEQNVILGDSADNSVKGFASFVLQQCLASTIEYESDSVLSIANVRKQEELLRGAMRALQRSSLWSSRIKLAQAWILYSQGIRTHHQRMLELLAKSTKETLSALRLLTKLHDYESLFSAYRLLFMINFRIFLFSDLKTGETRVNMRQMRKYTELLTKLAETIFDPVKVGSASSNSGVMLWAEAQFESDPSKRKCLLEEARKKYLNAASAVKGVNVELTFLPLFNAGSVLVSLSMLEQDVAKYNELLETASKELDEVIRISNGSTSLKIRLAAITAKLMCMDELARISPVNIPNEVFAELDHAERELDGLQSKAYDPFLLALAYENLTLYYLRLLRVRGTDQKHLLNKAEECALKAYEIDEKVPLYDQIGVSLYNIAATQMIKAILRRDVKLLTEAGITANRAAEALEKKGGFKFLIAKSLSVEIQVTKYGYTGDLTDLDGAIELSEKAVPGYIANKYLQMAGEESFRLATLFMLRGADKRAEQTLNEAAKLFREFGKENPQFSKKSQDFSVTCTATRKLVQAQIAFKAGRKSKATRLAEQAEREMIAAKARWREVWLIRGFKELIASNVQEAKTNLSRIIMESLDALQEKNPISTGYTAKRFVDFMNQRSPKSSQIPPAVIELPLKDEAILAALRLEKLGGDIPFGSAADARMEARELDVEDIRNIIKRLTEAGNKPVSSEEEATD